MKRIALRLLVPVLIVAGLAYAVVTAFEDGAASGPPPAVVAATGKLVAPGTPKAALPRKPSVVLIVMDELPVDLLRGGDGRINAERYPNFAALARTGTWFPNATTVYDSTTKAVPAILDGRLPKRGSMPNYRGHPRSIFDTFARRGYRIVSSETATSICPPRYCRGAKLERPAILPQLEKGRHEDMERFIGRVSRGRPTLYFKHVLLPHGPFLFLPSGKQSRRGFRDALPGMASVPGFYDPYLTRHNQQRIRLQLGFADRELGRLFARMDRQGILDKSLVAVVADHGISSEVAVDNRRVANQRNVDEVAPVPLFVKAPGQRRGRLVDSYVRTVDMLPTIADLLNIRVGFRTDGRSAFSRAVRRRRSAFMIKRDFSGRVTISKRALQRRRTALLRRGVKLYGDGGWATLYTGIGPNRELIGRTPAGGQTVSRASISGTIVPANYLRAVNPDSIVRPTQIAGTLSGGRREAKRDLAVAVNGRIEAVGRSFYLKGREPESFAINVPERSIRPGRNDVRLYEVTRGGGLALIART